jgi:hypothetical protein
MALLVTGNTKPSDATVYGAYIFWGGIVHVLYAEDILRVEAALVSRVYLPCH